MGKKLSASEIDGVQYRRAKLWQIILYACNAFVGMTVYSLIGMASYAASIGFGIGTAAIGVILTGTRILDGVTDPMLAFLYDKVNTKYGKIRILLIVGFVIEAVALLCMGGRKRSGNSGICIILCYLCDWLYNCEYDSTDNSVVDDQRSETASDAWGVGDRVELHGSDGIDNCIKCCHASEIWRYI